MKRTTLSTVLLSIAVGVGMLASGHAAAQAAGKDPLATPRIDQRQAKQQARINQGVASGKITPTANKATAKADGVVTQQERKSLKNQQNQANRAIARKKHNARAL
jgi:ABC-type sugar transport system substrate-binding protein